MSEFYAAATALVGIWKGSSLRDGCEVIVFIFSSEINQQKNNERLKTDEIIDHKFFKPEKIGARTQERR